MTFKRLLRLNSMSVGGLGVAVVLAAGLTYLATAHRAFKLPAEDTAAIITPQGSVLDLTSIGVQIPLANAVSDAVYAPFPIQNPGTHAYGVSSVALIKANSSPTCSAANGPLGLVVATTSQPTAPSGMSSVPVPVDNKTLFKIGSTYYRYVPPMETGCVGNGMAASTIEAAQKAFATSFASITADNVASTAAQ